MNIFFFLAGFASANWTVRVPAVKEHVGASATELGLVLLCMSLGGLVAMSQGGRLCVRYGTRPIVVVAGLGTFLALPLPTLAPSVPVLGLFLAVYGLMYGFFNIALNSAAVEVEKAAGRPVMSGLHGLYSTGALGGALVGGLAAARLTALSHLAVIAALGVVVALAFARLLLARAEPPAVRTVAQPKRSGLASMGPVVRLLAVVAFCTAFAEYSNNDWAVLHLGDDLGASPTLAAYGYAAYECAIAVTRLTGGKLIKIVGEAGVLVGGSLLATAGILVSAWAAALPGGLLLAFVAYVAVGLGVANLYPIAIARAGALGGPRAVSVVAPMATIGILIERPLVGLLADHLSLPTALSMVALLTVLAAVVGVWTRRELRPRQRAVEAVSVC
nr:MFS transporter [Microlunatus panaciterrae]